MAGGRGVGVAGQAGMNYPKLLPVNKVVSQHFNVVMGTGPLIWFECENLVPLREESMQGSKS